LRRLRDASELELPQPVDQWFEPLKIWSTILQVVDSRRLKIPPRPEFEPRRRSQPLVSPNGSGRSPGSEAREEVIWRNT